MQAHIGALRSRNCLLVIFLGLHEHTVNVNLKTFEYAKKVLRCYNILSPTHVENFLLQ